MDESRELRLQGQGDASIYEKGANGDLYFVTHVGDHRIFAREGDLQSKPAAPAAGPKGLFVIDKGGGRPLEAPRGRRP